MVVLLDVDEEHPPASLVEAASKTASRKVEAACCLCWWPPWRRLRFANQLRGGMENFRASMINFRVITTFKVLTDIHTQKL